jgi:hypothetical protein
MHHYDVQWHYLYIDFIKNSFFNKEIISLLQTRDHDHHMNLYNFWQLIRYERLTFPYHLKLSRQVNIVESSHAINPVKME